ncbi:hypothetical protein E8E12_000825 [Didymella heteroderae]|uniref:HORMA domain-containing protein n=1 Tax=Didymella heteroderae TaxID=1769908 RepID=A0A9P4WGK3_9PLEO|nr:hypothetical protein E8E12_000825 [Didymella heteroderae]
MAGATYTDTLNAFTNFVTAYVHTLLYLRSLYPRTFFVHSRFHNTSAYQSRHPLVCDWIRDAVDAVRTELLGGTVSRIGIVIFHCGNGSKSGSAEKETGDVQVMERFMIDVSAFPVVDEDERDAVLEWGSRPSSQASVGSAPLELDGSDTSSCPDRSRRGDGPYEPAFDLVADANLAEQMGAVLILLTTRCAQLNPLPDKCSFEIALELKDGADVDPPIGHPSAWIPVQPRLQKTGRDTSRHATVEADGEHSSMQTRHELEDKRKRGGDLGGLRFTPIRTVEAGTFKFETWVEEGRAKFEDMSYNRPDSPEVSFSEPKTPPQSKRKKEASFSKSSGDSVTR